MKKILSIVFVLSLIALPVLADALNPPEIKDYIQVGHFIGISFILFIISMILFSFFFVSKLEAEWQRAIFAYQSALASLILFNKISEVNFLRTSNIVVIILICIWYFIAILSLILVFFPKTRKMSACILIVCVASIGGSLLGDFIAEKVNSEEVVFYLVQEAEKGHTAYKADCEKSGGHLVGRWQCVFDEEKDESSAVLSQ